MTQPSAATVQQQPTSVAETLKAARALIEDPKHWTKGAYARSLRGRKVQPEGRAAVCWCIRGALRSVDGDYERAATDQLVAALGFEDRPYMTGALFGFNDSPETTHADVLAALDKAIALAETQS